MRSEIRDWNTILIHIAHIMASDIVELLLEIIILIHYDQMYDF